jgi:hypothetical protein
VADLLAVQVAHTLRYLSEKVAYQLLRKYSLSAFIFNELVQADPANVFLNQVDLLGRLEAIEQLYGVWVLQLLHALNLPHHRSFLVGVVQFVLGVDFHGDLLFSGLLGRQLHGGIGSGPEGTHLHIVVQFEALVLRFSNKLVLNR